MAASLDVETMESLNSQILFVTVSHVTCMWHACDLPISTIMQTLALEWVYCSTVLTWSGTWCSMCPSVCFSPSTCLSLSLSCPLSSLSTPLTFPLTASLSYLLSLLEFTFFPHVFPLPSLLLSIHIYLDVTPPLPSYSAHCLVNSNAVSHSIWPSSAICCHCRVHVWLHCKVRLPNRPEAGRSQQCHLSGERHLVGWLPKMCFS